MDQEQDEFRVFTAGESFYSGEDGHLEEDPEQIIMVLLIFLGVSPGALHIGYREELDGKARPAFDLDLVFCRSEHFYFTVKGRRFEVNRSDNDGLSLRACREPG